MYLCAYMLNIYIYMYINIYNICIYIYIYIYIIFSTEGFLEVALEVR